MSTIRAAAERIHTLIQSGASYEIAETQAFLDLDVPEEDVPRVQELYAMEYAEDDG